MNALLASLSAERDRWALWIPVVFGVGIAVYFLLSWEPPLLLGPAGVFGAAVATGAGYWARHRAAGVALMVTGLAVGIAAAGLCAAQYRTAGVETRLLEARVGPTGVESRIVAVESFPDSRRIVLERPQIAAVAAAKTPERVRIRVRSPGAPLRPGDWVRLRAILSPPSPPAAPGAFDFQRHAYFQGIGGIGFALGGIDIVAGAEMHNTVRLDLGLASLRAAVTARILSALPGTRGGVAAALTTGERSAVPEPVLAAIRDSGLAHLLSISGLHIGLVAGIVFAVIRAVLALVPAVALRYPVKKWAAVAAIVGAFGYALLAGATLPTQRAFLMIGLALLGVLVDRRGLSMRSVAWAAMVILALQPESLTGASFQMSFAAVIALIAGYEYLAERRQAALRTQAPKARTLWRTALRYLGGIALTTIIAGAATAPFAVYNFNRIADYGVIANLIAVPVTGLWVMPWAIAALLLLPFGLESLALQPMGWGIAVIVAVAEKVAAWPGAVTLVPMVPVWGLAALSVGGLWLCLWQGRWRCWGAAGIVVGLMSLAANPPPDILMDGNGRLLAIRGDNGGLWLNTQRGARFERELWARMLGDAGDAGVLPVSGRDLDGRLTCDIQGCLFRKAGAVAAFARSENAALEDCGTADLIVSLIPLRRKCPTSLTLDRFDLWREGAHAIWLDGAKIRVESVGQSRGRRPWVPQRPDARNRTPGN